MMSALQIKEFVYWERISLLNLRQSVLVGINAGLTIGEIIYDLKVQGQQWHGC